ncbi:MAG: hypothetical protein M0R80_05920 [Proteobacteria bacterium]|jgi:hypothetical protein|nr:hypothetical protein [Pseudomonadota bacterium]
MRYLSVNLMTKAALPLCLAIAVSAAACGGAQAAGMTFDDTAPVCEAPEETSRTLLVDWEPADRAALETTIEGNVAVVRYDGCTLELLDDCRLAGEYLLEDSSRSTGGFTVRDAAELEERLPLGAAGLEGEMRGGAALTLTYVTATTANARLSTRTRGMLSGGCDRATHFVKGMVRGAYEIGVEGAASKGARVVRDGGDLERCGDRKTAAKDDACRAIVQVVLTPISQLTAGRDDLYEDLGREVAGIANMEEALRVLQGMAGDPQPPSAPPAPAGPLSEVSRGILAVPNGGSDEWDMAVAPLLVAAYDKDSSKKIDTLDEVADIPCEVLTTMDRAVRSGRGGAATLRTTYGFPSVLMWVGYALGFDEKVRRDADARLANCGL